MLSSVLLTRPHVTCCLQRLGDATPHFVTVLPQAALDDSSVHTQARALAIALLHKLTLSFLQGLLEALARFETVVALAHSGDSSAELAD
jgi:hypothetical protein